MHTSSSVVYHKSNATASKQNLSTLYFLQERNRLLNFLLFFSKGFLIKYSTYLVINFFLKFFTSFFVKKYSLTGLIKSYYWLVTNLEWIKKQRIKLNSFKNVDEKDVLKFLSGKIFNGNNFVEKIINYFSLLYCKLMRIHVIENSKFS